MILTLKEVVNLSNERRALIQKNILESTQISQQPNEEQDNCDITNDIKKEN